MALSPEKNDVNISALFEYRKPVLISAKDQEIEVFMRVIGDSEMQRARVKALRASREMRLKLKNTESDEYLAFIPDLSDASKEKLIEITLLAGLKKITSEVVEEIDIPFPKEIHSEATLEEQEKYHKALDNYPKKREAVIKEKILAKANSFKEELKNLTKEQLKNEYIIDLKNEVCEIEMSRVFYDYIIFYSLYKDNSYQTPLFSKFEDFDKLPTTVKTSLLSEYRNLELGIDELKK